MRHSSPASSRRRILVVAHAGRPEAVVAARTLCRRLLESGIGVRASKEEAADIDVTEVEVVTESDLPAQDCELVVVLGGDGTILRGAELARPTETPLLGVNLGHVGFLAEAEHDDLETTVDRVVECSYEVEERLTVDVSVYLDGDLMAEGWALNDASVEKAARERMVDLLVEVDGRPLSRWAGDGVVCATPTGSTAYSFSAGGPVVWPEVEALLLAPISAHALFARPLVVSPDSVLAVEVQADSTGSAVLWCDGRRTVDLPRGARVEVRRGRYPVRLARLHMAPFTDRLVAKFDLPTTGWRGAWQHRDESAGRGGSATP